MLYIACDAGVKDGAYSYAVATFDTETKELACYVSERKVKPDATPAYAELRAFKHACKVAATYTNGVKMFTDQVSIIYNAEGHVSKKRPTRSKTANAAMFDMLSPVCKANNIVELAKINSHEGEDLHDLLHKLADAECSNVLQVTKARNKGTIISKIESMVKPQPRSLHNWVLEILVGYRGY